MAVGRISPPAFHLDRVEIGADTTMWAAPTVAIPIGKR